MPTMVSPFINGFGGYVISEDGMPGLNDPKTIEAAEYNKNLPRLSLTETTTP